MPFEAIAGDKAQDNAVLAVIRACEASQKRKHAAVFCRISL
jgi:hypothetical protein